MSSYRNYEGKIVSIYTPFKGRCLGAFRVDRQSENGTIQGEHIVDGEPTGYFTAYCLSDGIVIEEINHGTD